MKQILLFLMLVLTCLSPSLARADSIEKWFYAYVELLRDPVRANDKTNYTTAVLIGMLPVLKEQGYLPRDPKAQPAWRLNHDDMTGEDLSNVDLSEMNVLIGRLEKANLSNANLLNASFRFCSMD